MISHKIIHEPTGRELIIGEVIKSFRNEEYIYTGFTPGLSLVSSGRINVIPIETRDDEMTTCYYYPSVFNCKIIKTL